MNSVGTFYILPGSAVAQARCQQLQQPGRALTLQFRKQGSCFKRTICISIWHVRKTSFKLTNTVTRCTDVRMPCRLWPGRGEHRAPPSGSKLPTLSTTERQNRRWAYTTPGDALNIVFAWFIQIEKISKSENLFHSLFIWHRFDNYTVHTAYRTHLANGYQGLFPRCNMSECEADHSFPCSAEVQNAWSLASTSTWAFMALCSGTRIALPSQLHAIWAYNTACVKANYNWPEGGRKQ